MNTQKQRVATSKSAIEITPSEENQPSERYTLRSATAQFIKERFGHRCEWLVTLNTKIAARQRGHNDRVLEEVQKDIKRFFWRLSRMLHGRRSSRNDDFKVVGVPFLEGADGKHHLHAHVLMGNVPEICSRMLIDRNGREHYFLEHAIRSAIRKLPNSQFDLSNSGVDVRKLKNNGAVNYVTKELESDAASMVCMYESIFPLSRKLEKKFEESLGVGKIRVH